MSTLKTVKDTAIDVMEEEIGDKKRRSGIIEQHHHHVPKG